MLQEWDSHSLDITAIEMAMTQSSHSDIHHKREEKTIATSWQPHGKLKHVLRLI